MPTFIGFGKNPQDGKWHLVEVYEQNGECYIEKTICGIEVDDEPEAGWEWKSISEYIPNEDLCRFC